MKARNDIRILRALVALPLALVLVSGHSEAQAYTYDAAGRLTRVAYADGTSIDYAYDANGNRLALTANAAAPAGGGGGGGGGGCFIATVAYGSMLDPHVEALRDFRDEHMLTNAPGRFLICVYETTSPPIAAVIAEHESLRFLTRVLLSPIVLAAAYPRAALALTLALLCWRASRRWKGGRMLRGQPS